MIRTALVLAAACLGASACSMTPLVTKSRMTLGEANIKDMECRRETPIGTAQPRTVCASKEDWAAYDKKARYASEDLFQEVRTRNTVTRFNMPL